MIAYDLKRMRTLHNSQLCCVAEITTACVKKKIIFELVGNLPKESWKTQRAETDGPGHAEDCMALERELSLI